ncbi:hypothetical protein N8586_00520 [Verrucomicrobiales bacterium]|nr:hypothetical protein [Verrucomicrobiales bacterium]
MKRSIQLLSILFTSLLIPCASTNSSFPSVSELLVAPGSEDGLRVCASAPPIGKTHGRLRLVKQSVVDSTHADLFTGKSLTAARLMTKVSGAFGNTAQASAGTTVYTLGNLTVDGEANSEQLEIAVYK